MPIRCPKCKTEMEALAHEDLVVDQCPSCHGVWLDKGELDAVMRHKLANVLDARISAFEMHDHDEVPARCRRCDKEMVALVGPGEVRMDWCVECEGLFFDHGELSAIDRYEPG